MQGHAHESLFLDYIVFSALDVARQDAISNAYNIPNWHLEGYMCQTNTPTNTWCRGPTFVPAVFSMESMIEAVAHKLGVSGSVIREANMYNQGDKSAGGQTLAYCNQKLTYNTIKESSKYSELVSAAEAWNSANRYVKKGVSLVPLRYCMGLATGYAATITAHDDGTVLVQQSGCEIGQGLYTKVSQVAALSLNCDMNLITVDDCSSKMASGQLNYTGGSTTSEGSCASVKLACEDLLQKMAVATAKLEGQLGRFPTWHEAIVNYCKTDHNADKTGHGNFKGKKPETGLPGKSTNGSKQYECYGAACVAVEVDMLTGEVLIERADVLLDTGTSINPDIDAGQIQGAFVMGLGYCLSEEFNWRESDGRNLSSGTWEYKPPCSQDIPTEFNISLLPHAPNPEGILSSKATGEPAITASCSVLFAVQNALAAARKDAGIAEQPVMLNVPATGEKIHDCAGIDPSTFTLC